MLTAIHRSMRLLSIFALLFSPSIPSLAQKAQPTMSYEQGKVFGSLARLTVQSGYFLELLTTGECSQFALKKHDANEDLDEVMKAIPDEWLRKGTDVRAEIGSRAKELGKRDLTEWDNQIRQSGAGLELRCGVLFGIGSTTYFQARREWANLLNLPQPKWQQP